MTDLAHLHAQILDFTRRHPAACFHVIDMPYRLASPAAQDVANCRVWTDNHGATRGFGVIQLPFSALDWAVRPGDAALQPEIMAWGVARLEEIAQQRGEGFGYLLDSYTAQDTVAPRFGFELDDWHIRNLSLTLTALPASSPLPPGFKIRPLQGASEVAAYVDLHRAAFDTRNMSVSWRAQTLVAPYHRPQLDLVVEDPNGQLVAFCIGWLGEIDGTLVGQIEPLGVLPAFQGQGLGRAILGETLRTFYQMGVRQVHIDAESYNPASQSLYESVGFREQRITYKYFRRF